MARFGLGKIPSLKIAADRACFALVLTVIVLNIYKHYVLDAADPSKCRALLSDGQWLDSPDHGPYHIWQPAGCMIHEYTTPDIANCMGNGTILFVGDASVRHTFWSTARKVDADWVFEEQARWDIPHGDIEFSKDGVRLRFVFDPWLNGTALHGELERFGARQRSGYQARLASGLHDQTPRKGTTPLIVIGGGMWHARHLQSNSFERFQKSIDAIVSAAYPKGFVVSSGMPSFGGEEAGEHILFLPIIEPRYERLSPSREGSITPDKITKMNNYLEQMSPGSHSVLWAQNNMTSGVPGTYGESGLHVVENVSKKLVDVILNAHCNSHYTHKESHLMDRTCCISYKSLNRMQIGILVGAFISLLYAVIAIARSARLPFQHGASKDLPPQQLHSLTTPVSSTSRTIVALLTLLFCIGYCFLSDRTQLFDKVPKQYVTEEFRIILAILILPCLLTIRSSTSSSGPSNNSQNFFSREHSDEFKGWMQVFILVYGYTKSGDILDFYEVFRIFVAFYFFLLGYGHTMYFLRTNDFSMRRIATVLLRLNLLPVLLGSAMARPFTSYYFVPLASLWILVIFATMRTSTHRNATFRQLLGKVLSSATLVTGFVYLPGLLEGLSSILNLLFHAGLSPQIWRTTLGLDLYVVYIGMLAAIAHVRVCAILNLHESQRTDFHDFIHDCFEGLHIIAILASIVMLPVFWTLSRRSPDKGDYDWWMAAFSCIPILALVVLRNATNFLRSHHCAAFAWIGRRSLAFYVLSQHIWMAGDGKGLLRLFRGGDGSLGHDRWRELVIFTPILAWCAWKISDAYEGINAWILGGRGRHEEELLGEGAHKRSASESANSSWTKSKDRTLSKGAKSRLLIIVVAVWVFSLTT